MQLEEGEKEDAAVVVVVLLLLLLVRLALREEPGKETPRGQRLRDTASKLHKSPPLPSVRELTASITAGTCAIAAVPEYAVPFSVQRFRGDGEEEEGAGKDTTRRHLVLPGGAVRGNVAFPSLSVLLLPSLNAKTEN